MITWNSTFITISPDWNQDAVKFAKFRQIMKSALYVRKSSYMMGKQQKAC